MYRNKVIELTDVTTYAYAEYDDGSFGFWAAGKAGWFELRDPAPAYKHMFASMNEATAMFYTIADKTTRAYKSHRTMSAKAVASYATVVFKDYLHHGKSFARRIDVEDVRDGFHEHRQFLISSMLDVQDQESWEQAPMYRYFKSNFPDDFKRIIARKASEVSGKAKNEKKIRNATNSDPSENSVKNENRQAKEIIPDIRSKGKPRKRKPPGKTPQTPVKQLIDVDKTLDVETSADEDGDARKGKKIVSRKRKSILQPKSSKYSKKGTGKRNSTIDDSDDGLKGEEASFEIEVASPRRTSPLAQAMIQPPIEKAKRKNPKPIPQNKGLPSPESLGSSPIEPSIPSHGIFSLAGESTNPLHPRTMNAIPQPQPPKERWKCSFDHCTFTIPNESSEQGKTDIQNHFETHTDQAPGMIDLVLQEARPYLPVDNLVRRLQMFAGRGQA